MLGSGVGGGGVAQIHPSFSTTLSEGGLAVFLEKGRGGSRRGGGCRRQQKNKLELSDTRKDKTK